MATGIDKNISNKEFRTRLIRCGGGPDLVPADFNLTPATQDEMDDKIFNMKIRPEDTLLTEEISSNNGYIWALKFLQITNPPPTNLIQIEMYRKVTKLEINCKIDINWLFCNVLHKLPRLEFLKLGTQVFDNQQQQLRSEYALQGIECPTIRHLHLRTTPTAQKGETISQLIQNVNLVLDYTSLYLKKLSLVDFRLPIDTKFHEFLLKFPKLQSAGNLNVSYKHQIATVSNYPPKSHHQTQQEEEEEEELDTEPRPLSAGSNSRPLRTNPKPDKATMMASLFGSSTKIPSNNSNRRFSDASCESAPRCASVVALQSDPCPSAAGENKITSKSTSSLIKKVKR